MAIQTRQKKGRQQSRRKTTTNAGYDLWSQDFSYDIWGNMEIPAAVNAPMLAVSIDANNQISDTGFAYDAAGNMTVTPSVPGILVYDAENRLVQVGADIFYKYDGDGNLSATDACTTPPPFPPGESVSANIAELEILASVNHLLALGVWFGNVAPFGSQDYKRYGVGLEFEDAGNFNYGATGAALGIPGPVLEYGAGFVGATVGVGSSGVGSLLPTFVGPFLILPPLPPYGDQPSDNSVIRQGIQYGSNACSGGTTP